MDDETHEFRRLGIEPNRGPLNHRFGTVHASDQQLIEHQGLKIHADGNGSYRRAANGADPAHKVLSKLMRVALALHVHRDCSEHGQEPADPVSQFRTVCGLLSVHVTLSQLLRGGHLGSTIRAFPNAFTNLG
jgi:hypothetical protein